MKTTKKATYKDFLKNDGRIYPTLKIAKTFDYMNIEGKDIYYISCGKIHLFFYMKNGDRFKVNLA